MLLKVYNILSFMYVPKIWTKTTTTSFDVFEEGTRQKKNIRKTLHDPGLTEYYETTINTMKTTILLK